MDAARAVELVHDEDVEAEAAEPARPGEELPRVPAIPVERRDAPAEDDQVGHPEKSG